MDVREKLVELPIEDALLILREEHRQRTDSYTTYLAHGGKGDPAEEVGLDALAMAISALKQQQEQESKPLNGWISVKDRLPLCGDRVIMTDGVFVCEAFLSISGKWVRNGISWIESEITRWMPMPEPPEMEKTEK